MCIWWSLNTISHGYLLSWWLISERDTYHFDRPKDHNSNSRKKIKNINLLSLLRFEPWNYGSWGAWHTNVPGVDFIKVWRKAQIIEIALSKLGARRKVHPRPLKSFSKVGHRAWIGRIKFMKSTPGCAFVHNTFCKCQNIFNSEGDW